MTWLTYVFLTCSFARFRYFVSLCRYSTWFCNFILLREFVTFTLYHFHLNCVRRFRYMISYVILFRDNISLRDSLHAWYVILLLILLENTILRYLIISRDFISRYLLFDCATRFDILFSHMILLNYSLRTLICYSVTWFYHVISLMTFYANSSHHCDTWLHHRICSIIHYTICRVVLLRYLLCNCYTILIIHNFSSILND